MSGFLDDERGAEPALGAGVGAVVTRHEEQLRVAVRAVPYERVTVRKVVVVEQVTQVIEVRREELRIERTPVADATGVVELTQVGGLAAVQDGVLDLVLSEERPVVTLQAVPVERVRVRTRVVTRNEVRQADLRREELDLDTTGTTRPVGPGPAL